MPVKPKASKKLVKQHEVRTKVDPYKGASPGSLVLIKQLPKCFSRDFIKSIGTVRTVKDLQDNEFEKDYPIDSNGYAYGLEEGYTDSTCPVFIPVWCCEVVFSA